MRDKWHLSKNNNEKIKFYLSGGENLGDLSGGENLGDVCVCVCV